MLMLKDRNYRYQILLMQRKILECTLHLQWPFKDHCGVNNFYDFIKRFTTLFSQNTSISPTSPLFHRYRLSQIARLVDVGTFQHCDVIRKQL